MSTLVFFHAHPDDESIVTGGVMAQAAEQGHRVVLVVATGGEEGEVADGFLAEGESLGERRRDEQEVSAGILGVSHLVWLGYRDSGMMGTEANQHPSCFWQADLDEAAQRLAAVLDEEQADVIVVYDQNGGYGHPDHIQVHRVGHRAAALAATPRVYEVSMNRDLMASVFAELEDAENPQGEEHAQGADHSEDGDSDDEFGLPDAELTTAVDVTAYLDVKRASMRAHASQIAEDSWFLSLPDEIFTASFGTEWFVRIVPPFTGRIPEDRETSLLDGPIAG